ncbi:MAG: outer membrane protein transport protein [Fusobacterium perfoetens]|uniref:OmpP1/FadL family transporter n=1 Tax=Fusobacterium perfoetens TaxID=852 RepID=UPI0023F31B98|nr:outer membrane protein transport protein [Fusobacterium perfoetens]MCI6152144.1 outer membrane protein transport protein [Fusobacterium perfoetens]MDY3237965.1 outer membrane protein transport protein [Fusobacterium perfoetens]
MNLKKLTIASLLISATAFGASIDHVQNYTAEYGANPAQQGAINYGTTVNFNPAGLMKLENGTYFAGGLQYAFGDQKMTQGREFDTDLSSPIPNFAIYKKTDDGALFWTFGAVAGGASLEYKNSIPLPDLFPGVNMNTLLENTNLKGSNQYAQMTFGKAWNVNEKLSMSLGLRAVYGLRTLEASTYGKNIKIQTPAGEIQSPLTGAYASIDSERTAFGFGGQVGLNYAATDRLNIGFRYDSRVKLDFKTEATYGKNGNGQLIIDNLLGIYPVYADGLKTRRDLPALMALGASYKVTDDWTTFIGGNYYFNKDAKMDRVGKDPGRYDYDNGWEISLGSEYKLNEKVSWLVGFNYADTGAKGTTYAATEYAIDSIMVGTGFKIQQNETTEWTIAYNHYFYDSTTFNGIKYEKDIRSIGFNFVKKF